MTPYPGTYGISENSLTRGGMRRLYEKRPCTRVRAPHGALAPFDSGFRGNDARVARELDLLETGSTTNKPRARVGLAAWDCLDSESCQRAARGARFLAFLLAFCSLRASACSQSALWRGVATR